MRPKEKTALEVAGGSCVILVCIATSSIIIKEQGTLTLVICEGRVERAVVAAGGEGGGGGEGAVPGGRGVEIARQPGADR